MLPSIFDLKEVAGAEEDQADDGGREQNPKELIPVEEGDAPEGGGVAGVEGREQKRQVGKQKKEPDAAGFARGRRRRRGGAG